jgi:hypothetical protein
MQLVHRKIPHEFLPVSATKPDPRPCKAGDFVYWYTSDRSPSSLEYYGYQHLAEIRRRTGLTIIEASLDQYDKRALNGIYQECFAGLRLTKFDGLPNTVLEMGLLGRPCIYNGDIPTSVHYSSVRDICFELLRLYRDRHKYNQIAHTISNYITLPESWKTKPVKDVYSQVTLPK